MRKQIAAANWKMNLTYEQGEKLLQDILAVKIPGQAHQQVIFAVPFPYLIMAKTAVAERTDYSIAAQNCYSKKSGAYTGEVSAEMLYSIGIRYCVIGHSERREYFQESDEMLAEKINLLLVQETTPVFCCGEPLEVRKAAGQNKHVETQLQKSLFHLTAEQVSKLVIAYEPIWAIGTGQTATTEQAQEMHAFLRSVLEKQWGKETAEAVSILYGGSVKASNAAELFACPDVDGGLVGGASLVAQDFVQIIKALK
ncbi:MAG: triose-phosphate isomerase [Williamsia sp.]|nr:triose-phosphate isomerase [Williamsia sp.]